MANITVIAQVKVLQEAIETAKAELLALVPPTRKESGCIEYTLHQDNQNPALFIFYETWESSAALEKHIGSDHYKAYAKALDGLLVEKVVHKLTRIES